ncbi:MAG TPA: hypothetical protein VFV95_12655 [Vicinamibacterales bacterium]|nr:hypothetical protein [Vicinamibacterales bacterium]
MFPRTPCQYCGTTGFVRKEHVLRAKEAYTQFYCSLCNKAWAEIDSENRTPATNPQGVKPDAPRV